MAAGLRLVAATHTSRGARTGTRGSGETFGVLAENGRKMLGSAAELRICGLVGGGSWLHGCLRNLPGKGRAIRMQVTRMANGTRRIRNTHRGLPVPELSTARVPGLILLCAAGPVQESGAVPSQDAQDGAVPQDQACSTALQLGPGRPGPGAPGPGAPMRMRWEVKCPDRGRCPVPCRRVK